MFVLYYTIPCTQMLKSSFCDRRWRKGDYCQVQSWKVREGKNLQNYSWLLALYISFVFINSIKRKDLFFCFCQQPYYIELYTSFFLLAILYILEAFLFEWNALLVRQTTDLQFNEFFEVTFSIKRQRNLKISTFTICKHDAFFCQSAVGSI